MVRRGGARLAGGGGGGGRGRRWEGGIRGKVKGGDLPGASGESGPTGLREDPELWTRPWLQCLPAVRTVTRRLPRGSALTPGAREPERGGVWVRVGYRGSQGAGPG